MEISSRTTANLLKLNNISIDELRAICKYFLQALITGESTTTVDEKLQDELCALSTLMLEASKLRSSSETVRKSLIELGLNEEVTRIVSDVYDKYSGKIIEHMETTGTAPKIGPFIELLQPYFDIIRYSPIHAIKIQMIRRISKSIR